MPRLILDPYFWYNPIIWIIADNTKNLRDIAQGFNCVNRYHSIHLNDRSLFFLPFVCINDLRVQSVCLVRVYDGFLCFHCFSPRLYPPDSYNPLSSDPHIMQGYLWSQQQYFYPRTKFGMVYQNNAIYRVGYRSLQSVLIPSSLSLLASDRVILSLAQHPLCLNYQASFFKLPRRWITAICASCSDLVSLRLFGVCVDWLRLSCSYLSTFHQCYTNILALKVYNYYLALQWWLKKEFSLFQLVPWAMCKIVFANNGVSTGRLNSFQRYHKIRSDVVCHSDARITISSCWLPYCCNNSCHILSPVITSSVSSSLTRILHPHLIRPSA